SFLTVDGEVPGHERVVDLDVAELCNQRDKLRLELGEDLAYLRSRRVWLEVVEQDVVRLLDAVEAVDIAPAKFDSALALTQTGRACADARVISARSSVGTRDAFSY